MYSINIIALPTDNVFIMFDRFVSSFLHLLDDFSFHCPKHPVCIGGKIVMFDVCFQEVNDEKYFNPSALNMFSFPF